MSAWRNRVITLADFIKEFPYRYDFRDQSLNVDSKIANREELMFMGNVTRDVVLNWKYYVCVHGALTDGQRAVLLVEGIKPWITVLAEPNPDKMKLQISSILTESKARIQFDIEVIDSKEFMGWQANPQKFLKISFDNTIQRKKAISAINAKHIKVHHDDAVYYIAATREFNLPIAGWSTITDYQVDQVDQFNDHDGHKNLVIRVHYKNYKPFTGDIFKTSYLAKDKLITAAFDIECSSRRDTFPDVEVKESDGESTDKLFMIAGSFHWHAEKSDLIQVCFVDQPCDPHPNYLTVYCSEEKFVIIGFAYLLCRMKPDFIIGFNVADFDWKWIVVRAWQHGILPQICDIMDTFKYPTDQGTHHPLSRQSYEDFCIREKARVLDQSDKTAEHDFSYANYVSHILGNWDSKIYRHEKIKIDAETYSTGKQIQLFGSISVDVRTVMRQANPGDDKSSLNHFLEKCKLKLKKEMTIAEMNSVYWELFKKRKTMTETEMFGPELADLRARMKEVAEYCVIDSYRCQELMLKQGAVTDKRGVADLSKVSIGEAFTRAGGMKVINIVHDYIERAGMQWYTKPNPEEKTKFPGAYVIEPVPQLVTSKHTFEEQIRANDDYLSIDQPNPVSLRRMPHPTMQEFRDENRDRSDRVQKMIDIFKCAIYKTKNAVVDEDKFIDGLMQSPSKCIIENRYNLDESGKPIAPMIYNENPNDEIVVCDADPNSISKIKEIVLDLVEKHNRKVNEIAGAKERYNNLRCEIEKDQAEIKPFLDRYNLLAGQTQINQNEFNSLSALLLGPSGKFNELNLKCAELNKLGELLKINVHNLEPIVVTKKAFAVLEDFLRENTGRGVSGLDFSSLYPSIIIAYNLSPDTTISLTTCGKNQAAFIKKLGTAVEKVGKENLFRNTFPHNGKDITGFWIKHHGKIERYGILPKMLLDLMAMRKKAKEPKEYYGFCIEYVEAANTRIEKHNKIVETKEWNQALKSEKIKLTRYVPYTEEIYKKLVKDGGARKISFYQTGIVYQTYVKPLLEAELYYNMVTKIKETEGKKLDKEDHECKANIEKYREFFMPEGKTYNEYDPFIINKLGNPGFDPNYPDDRFRKYDNFTTDPNEKYNYVLCEVDLDEELFKQIALEGELHLLEQFSIREIAEYVYYKNVWNHVLCVIDQDQQKKLSIGYIAKILNFPLDHIHQFGDVEYYFNYFNAKQNAIKLIMNTTYGKMGDSNSPLYDLALAGSVTSLGKTNILMVKEEFLEKGMKEELSNFCEDPNHRKQVGGCNCGREFYKDNHCSNHNHQIEIYKAVSRGDRYECGCSRKFKCRDNCRIWYGDTDSIYLSAPNSLFRDLDKSFYSGVISKENYWTMIIKMGFEITNAIQEVVNKNLQAYHGTKHLQMAYEEVLWNVAFLSKKKYYGNEHKSEPNLDTNRKMFARGLEVRKRGIPPVLKDITEGIMRRSLQLDNLDDLLTLSYKAIDRFYKQSWKLKDFARLKAYKPISAARRAAGKGNKSILAFADRMTEQGIELKPFEKFQYVNVKRCTHYIDRHGKKQKRKASDLMELLDVAERRNYQVDIDSYLKSCIAGQLARLIVYRPEFRFEATGHDKKSIDDANKKSVNAAKKHLIQYSKAYFHNYDQEIKEMKVRHHANIHEVQNRIAGFGHHISDKEMKILINLTEYEDLNFMILWGDIESEELSKFNKKNPYNGVALLKKPEGKQYLDPQYWTRREAEIEEVKQSSEKWFTTFKPCLIQIRKFMDLVVDQQIEKVDQQISEYIKCYIQFYDYVYQYIITTVVPLINLRKAVGDARLNMAHIKREPDKQTIRKLTEGILKNDTGILTEHL